MSHHDDRITSKTEYTKLCPVTMKPHDWRAATDAPGRMYGDACVRCEDCQQKAIYETGESRRLPERLGSSNAKT